MPRRHSNKEIAQCKARSPTVGSGPGTRDYTSHAPPRYAAETRAVIIATRGANRVSSEHKMRFTCPVAVTRDCTVLGCEGCRGASRCPRPGEDSKLRQATSHKLERIRLV